MRNKQISPPIGWENQSLNSFPLDFQLYNNLLNLHFRKKIVRIIKWEHNKEELKNILQSLLQYSEQNMI